MVRQTDADDRTAAEQAVAAAEAFAESPNGERFADLRGSVEAEYRDAGHAVNPGRNDTVPTVVASSIKDAADALGFEVTSMIDFDSRDRVTVKWDMEDAERGAVPADLLRLAAEAQANAGDRDVSFKPDTSSRRANFRVERGRPSN